MNRHPDRRASRKPRLRGVALAVSVLALLLAFCAQLSAINLADWRSVLAAGPATPDEALGAICGTLALSTAGWLLGALLLSLLAAACGDGRSRFSTSVSAGARLIAPAIMRSAAAALLGVAVVTVPAAAAGPGEVGPPQTAPSLMLGPAPANSTLSPSWLPPSTADESLLPRWLPEPPRARPGTGSIGAQRAVDHTRTIGGMQRPGAAADDEIVIRRGDTLWSLAARHLGPGATDGQIALEWPHWFTANRSVIGSNPDHLVPGKRLRPPESEPLERNPRAAQSGQPRQGEVR